MFIIESVNYAIVVVAVAVWRVNQRNGQAESKAGVSYTQLHAQRKLNAQFATNAIYFDDQFFNYGQNERRRTATTTKPMNDKEMKRGK